MFLGEKAKLLLFTYGLRAEKCVERKSHLQALDISRHSIGKPQGIIAEDFR